MTCITFDYWNIEEFCFDIGSHAEALIIFVVLLLIFVDMSVTALRTQLITGGHLGREHDIEGNRCRVSQQATG